MQKIALTTPPLLHMYTYIMLNIFRYYIHDLNENWQILKRLGITFKFFETCKPSEDQVELAPRALLARMVTSRMIRWLWWLSWWLRLLKPYLSWLLWCLLLIHYERFSKWVFCLNIFFFFVSLFSLYPRSS